MFLFPTCIVPFINLAFLGICISLQADETYPSLFRSATEAYLDNDWKACVERFEKSLSLYKTHKEGVLKCRRRCKTEVVEPAAEDEYNQLERFYEAAVHGALCLLRCERDVDSIPITTEKQLEQDFVDRVPYDYLQLCYFKIGENLKAASSAYTFLQHHPEHDIMRHNLNYYLNLPGVDANFVKYLEPQEYQGLYLAGAKAYASGQNKQVVQAMEHSLQSYLIAEEDCHLLCEGALASPAFTSLLVTVANHYTYALRCKHRCPYQLSLFSGESYEDILSSILHYLQFSYYKVGELKKACQAVASYLLLNEDDNVMLENQRFYLGLHESKKEWFTPFKEVESYYRRQKKMEKTLKFIDEAFNFTLNPIVPQRTISRSSRKSDSDSKGVQDPNIKITMGEEELGAKHRFVADGLSTKAQCKSLMEMAESGATLGDGYNGSHSPHTEFESFEGLTIGRTITLLQSGSLSASDVSLLLDVSDKARQFVESTFNLSSDLYFAYTHLVCRTARPELADSRKSSDLSHPVHADNCLLTPGGQCLKQRPAYTWRDYSAILYLNEEFEGGQFFFAQPKEEEVSPHCGRLVAFSAGHENLHGVRAVKKGCRCALAMWYTLDPRHQEKERHIALQAAAEKLEKEKKDGISSHAHSDL